MDYMDYDDTEKMDYDNTEKRDDSIVDVENYTHQRNGYINIQNVPVKKNRFKKIMPFIACTLISAIIGGIAGGAYVNYLAGKNTYTTPITSSTSQNQARTVTSYTPPNSLIAKIAEEVGPAIVGISTKAVARGFFGQSSIRTGSGSGIIFDKSGYIITNQHVIDGGEEITVTLAGGNKTFKARVVGADAKSDLAVLKINADNLPVAKLGDSDKIRVGDLAVAIGNPMGEEYAGSVTAGIISALNRRINLSDGEYDRRYKLIQTDAAINPGNSGGALINENGEVIGINTIKFVDSTVEGMGFAIPINDAMPIIDQLMKNGYVSRPYMGVEVITVTEEMAKDYNTRAGVGIQMVIRGGAAEAAGLKPGDVIIEIDGVALKTSDDLVSELEKHKVGDSVKLKIWRDGQILTIPVTLGENRQQSR